MVAAGLGRATYTPRQPRGDRSPNAEEAVKVLLDGAGCGVAQRAGHESQGLMNPPPAEGMTSYRVWLTAELLPNVNSLDR